VKKRKEKKKWSVLVAFAREMLTRDTGEE